MEEKAKAAAGTKTDPTAAQPKPSPITRPKIGGLGLAKPGEETKTASKFGAVRKSILGVVA